MHSTDRRLAAIEFSVNDLQKCIKDLNHFNHQDHKTLQDALQESMTQVNDWRSRLTQEITALKTSYASLAEEQRTLQAQVKQLLDFRAAASPELAALGAARRELEARHGALCDCLSTGGGGSLQVRQLRARSRVREGLACLAAALSKREALRAVAHFSGGGGAALARLASAGRCLGGARSALAAARAGCGLEPPAAAGEQGAASSAAAPKLRELDEGSWQTVADFEPSKEVLAEWAKSEMVQHAFGSFGVQGVMGPPEAMSFGDVYGLFGQIDLSLERFVNKFAYLPTHGSSSSTESELVAKADAILRQMTVEKGHGEQCIGSSDVYRLLELVGFPLSRFRSIFKSDDDGEDKPESQLKIGSYRVRRQIGQGFHGVCCYLGEKASDSSVRVAIKWPAVKEEIAALEDIHRRAGQGSDSCLGVPRLLDHGNYEGQPYMAQELLGSTLASVFERLMRRPEAARWQALRLVGRLLVRRLRALHESGYVHCDISPDNVLVGHASPRQNGGANGSPDLTLYLIDFELAQRYPGGAKLTPDQGSAEWSSIRSADGGERLPEDDLEALGWVLLNGLVGALPWFDWLQSAYKDWDSKWVRRQATRQVRRAKIMILEEGLASLPSKKKPLELPEELARFLRACHQPRPEAAQGKLPDYDALLAIFGSSPGPSQKEADRSDLLEFGVLVREANKPETEEAAKKRRSASVREELEEALARKDRGQLHAVLRRVAEAGVEDKEGALVARARAMLQDEEAHGLARAALQAAVDARDPKRICSALRDAELAGLPEQDMASARTALDEDDGHPFS